METDDRLIASLARDVDATFPSLVAAHQDRLFSIALRMLGHHADAEEVAQDALVRAYRALAGYDATRIAGIRLTPWLASIAVNLARNKRRRVGDKRPPVPLAGLVDGAVEPRGGDPGPEDHALSRESRDALAAALLTLPVTIRAPIVLRHVTGLSLAETAAALGRPEGTVKAQVSRGLARLRVHLEDPAPGSTVAASSATNRSTTSRTVPSRRRAIPSRTDPVLNTEVSR